jgi:hypothetical protein
LANYGNMGANMGNMGSMTSAMSDYLPELTGSAMTFLPYVGQAYQVYKGIKNLRNIQKGFSEGGFRGGLSAYVSQIPLVGGSLGGMLGKKKGGSEGKAITSAATGVIGEMNDILGSFNPRGIRNSGLLSAYSNLVKANKEFGTGASSKGHAWAMIANAQDALDKFRKAGSSMRIRGGGGGRPLILPESGTGGHDNLRIPRPKLNLPALEGGEGKYGASISGPSFIPSSGTATGFPRGRAYNPYSPASKSYVPRNPMEDIKAIKWALS